MKIKGSEVPFASSPLPFCSSFSIYQSKNMMFSHNPSTTEQRRQEFLWSDVCYLADQGATPLSLCQVIAATPLQVAELANRELPIRFAKRIRQIEERTERAVSRWLSLTFNERRKEVLDVDFCCYSNWCQLEYPTICFFFFFFLYMKIKPCVPWYIYIYYTTLLLTHS